MVYDDCGPSWLQASQANQAVNVETALDLSEKNVWSTVSASS